jgi:8-oxo-dGTP pyrophosphatase MutT (NUDIX family)
MPQKKSYGAILYSFNPSGELGIILGSESVDPQCGFFPFKGGSNISESPVQTAIREVFEETRGLVNLHTLQLRCKIRSKHKTYLFGLAEVNYDIIEKFNKIDVENMDPCYKEKKEIKFFRFADIYLHKFPAITMDAILFFKKELNHIALAGRSALL